MKSWTDKSGERNSCRTFKLIASQFFAVSFPFHSAQNAEYKKNTSRNAIRQITKTVWMCRGQNFECSGNGITPICLCQKTNNSLLVPPSSELSLRLRVGFKLWRARAAADQCCIHFGTVGVWSCMIVTAGCGFTNPITTYREWNSSCLLSRPASGGGIKEIYWDFEITWEITLSFLRGDASCVIGEGGVCLRVDQPNHESRRLLKWKGYVWYLTIDNASYALSCDDWYYHVIISNKVAQIGWCN